MKTHHGKDMCKGASRSYSPKSFNDANLCVRDIEPVRSEFGPEVQRRGQLVMTRTEHWRVTKVSCTLGSQVKDNKRTPEASVLPCMFFFSYPLVSGLSPMQSSPGCVSFLSEHIVASRNGSTRAVIQRTTNRNVCNRYSHQDRKHSGAGQGRRDQT